MRNPATAPKLVAALGIVLLTATACAEGASSAGAPTPPSSQAPALLPSSSQPPPGSIGVPATQVDSSSLPADYPREVYVTADGKTLHVRAEEGGCDRASAEVQQETARRVVITLLQTQPMLKGHMCTMDMRYPLVSVPLSDPLGERTVVLVSLRRN